MKTIMAKPGQVERKWYVVDAAGKPLGRLSAGIARILMGKHKPIWTPGVDCGDFVIVINAEKVALSGSKELKKVYYDHSGYLGGQRVTPAWQLRQKKPEQLIYRSVKGMLPKNSLGRRQITHLKVYAGPEHPHQAQQPEKIELP
ncbi:MAG TPA: 50S ribosomal protein L13 [Coprothermobacter sp.]|uniref:Large ribosomal subunit protein uL13 n=1 Tax=Coprothermobacter proteolyticus (strain ATCC 35245 / DSM 5265 / OCM 4 / BT) TaxID=309798 RepID=RL13_COPPD|nr:RecName: Full=Large ribosomal subunit protein uL13; AltName: Full=50S ribosomal protein L13 [Coprothermobacter proteolyticus DSM 5265]ACI17236.1 50S ribosomal protein L13 [Coprothermobacter proteolyticus DSM 5265]HAR40459.1 50S ribosomal protein L13 [Coprothermobacter sp.]